MGDNNTPFQGHPFYTALSIFNAAVRTPLNIAAAFWRPWFTDDANRYPVQVKAKFAKFSLTLTLQSVKPGMHPSELPTLIAQAADTP